MPVPTILAGRYRLRGLLGHGGMGDVYDAWDERLRRPVAVKVLRSEFADKADIRIRFESEASTAATLNHPNVVSVYDSGEDRGAPFIVMERLPGRTLSEEIEAGPLPPDRVRAILSDVLSALAAAHAAGILHRDIKPGNVLFSATGIVKVGDFGIAKTADSAHTTTGEVLGTVAYLSPQRIEGRPATVGDDIYAVGVVGYEAITGRRPFAGDNIASMARNILQQRPEPLAALNPNADAALVHAVERAMAPDPATRFSTAVALRAALQTPPPALRRPPHSRPHRPGDLSRRHPPPRTLPRPVGGAPHRRGDCCRGRRAARRCDRSRLPRRRRQPRDAAVGCHDVGYNSHHHGSDGSRRADHSRDRDRGDPRPHRQRKRQQRQQQRQRQRKRQRTAQKKPKKEDKNEN